MEVAVAGKAHAHHGLADDLLPGSQTLMALLDHLDPVIAKAHRHGAQGHEQQRQRVIPGKAEAGERGVLHRDGQQHIDHARGEERRHAAQRDEQAAHDGGTLLLAVGIDIPTDPDIESIEKAVTISKQFNVDAIVSIGGGSTMDAGKIVAARLNNKKSIRKMRGLLKVTKKPIFMIAIPTTCGTGSECTVASVVTDLATNEKYAINDPKLIPQYAVLDPTVLLTLPKHLIATTALDALTHAIEAYIGRSNTETTKTHALSAIHEIMENLIDAYNYPDDLILLSVLQKASFDAGIAFTKAYVGYVHAFSHAISAYYHLPHGYLNGVLLPIILANNYNLFALVESSVTVSTVVNTSANVLTFV